jgi:DNA-binding transcriptional ArsR family regulator
LEADNWRVLGVFENRVRVEVVKLLLEFEFQSLTEIAESLARRGWKMTLSGVLKHMRELENAGIVRHELGIFAEKPDARKTIYFLEGRERVEKVLLNLEKEIVNPLQVGALFGETAKVARQVQGMRGELAEKEKKHLESLLAACEAENVYKHLTEDERKKLKLWSMLVSFM